MRIERKCGIIKKVKEKEKFETISAHIISWVMFK
jgi:hypothetical protein